MTALRAANDIDLWCPPVLLLHSHLRDLHLVSRLEKSKSVLSCKLASPSTQALSNSFARPGLCEARLWHSSATQYGPRYWDLSYADPKICLQTSASAPQPVTLGHVSRAESNSSAQSLLTTTLAVSKPHVSHRGCCQQDPARCSKPQKDNAGRAPMQKVCALQFAVASESTLRPEEDP